MKQNTHTYKHTQSSQSVHAKLVISEWGWWILSMISWLWYCSIVTQDVTLGWQWVKTIWDLSELFLKTARGSTIISKSKFLKTVIQCSVFLHDDITWVTEQAFNEDWWSVYILWFQGFELGLMVGSCKEKDFGLNE